MPKILLVEDHQEIWDFLSRRLKRRGYEVEVAVDGQQGLDRARAARPEGKGPQTDAKGNA